MTVPVVGWAIEERTGGMGAFDTSLRLYAQRRTKVVSVLEADTGSDDIAAVTEEGNGSRFTTAVTQDLGPFDSGFYGLHAVQSQQEIERGKREIERATSAALKELAESSANLAVDLAGRIVESKLSAQDHARLIEQAMASFPRGNHSSN